MNASEFMYLEAPDRRLELRRGIVCEREFLGAAGGSATCQLLCAVHKTVQEDIGVVILAGGTGFLIQQNPDTVIAPNGAIFVHRDLSSCSEDEYLAIPPDIVIETWTPNGHAAEYPERASWWLRFGVKQVWELNAASALIVHQQRTEAQTLSIEDILDGSKALSKYTSPEMGCGIGVREDAWRSLRDGYVLLYPDFHTPFLGTCTKFTFLIRRVFSNAE